MEAGEFGWEATEVLLELPGLAWGLHMLVATMITKE